MTSARTESALSAFPLRFLYINIVKKQKILNIVRKNTKNIWPLEKSQHLLQRDYQLLPLPPPPKGMGLRGLNKMNNEYTIINF